MVLHGNPPANSVVIIQRAEQFATSDNRILVISGFVGILGAAEGGSIESRRTAVHAELGTIFNVFTVLRVYQFLAYTNKRLTFRVTIIA
jgi:hypothetical protein